MFFRYIWQSKNHFLPKLATTQQFRPSLMSVLIHPSKNIVHPPIHPYQSKFFNYLLPLYSSRAARANALPVASTTATAILANSRQTIQKKSSKTILYLEIYCSIIITKQVIMRCKFSLWQINKHTKFLAYLTVLKKKKKKRREKPADCVRYITNNI